MQYKFSYTKSFSLLFPISVICLSVILSLSLYMSTGPVYSISPNNNDDDNPLSDRTDPDVADPKLTELKVVDPAIVGGEDANPAQWPWQVAILTDDPNHIAKVDPYGRICGGSLIHPEWVLTAGHCVTGPYDLSQLTIVAGVHDFSLADDPNRQEIGILTANVHPRYNWSVLLDHDAALIRLKEPLEINEYVQTIRLATEEDEALMAAGQMATTTGWGLLAERGDVPDILQMVEVPIVSDESCKQVYDHQVTENMLCAGYLEGGQDSCTGDSGGPLVVPDGDDGWKLAGVVSWGEGCAQAGFYGVYSKVSRFNTWIHWDIDHAEPPSSPLEPTPTEMPTEILTATATDTPVPTATNTATNTATDTPTSEPTSTSEPALTPTVTPADNIEDDIIDSETGGAASAAIPNGSFEYGADGEWQEQSSQYSLQNGSLIVLAETVNAIPQRFSGYLARLGGTHNENSTLAQTIELPDSEELYLIFDYTIRSNDLCGYDTGTVSINGRNVADYDLCIDHESESWIAEALDISQYAGQSITLQFNAQTDRQLVSSFMIDNLALRQNAPDPAGANVTPTTQVRNWSIETASGQQGIALDWEAYPDMEVTQYQIQRKADVPSGRWVTIARIDDTYYYDGINHTDSTADKSYCYRIRALHEDESAVLTYSATCAAMGHVQLWTPLLFGKPQAKIAVPVNIVNSNGLQITKGEVKLEFDPTVLAIDSVQSSILTSGYVFSHTIEAGSDQFSQLQVQVEPISSVNPLLGRGPLFWVNFQVIGQHGEKSKLDVVDFSLGDANRIHNKTKLAEAFPYMLEQQLGGLLVQKEANFIPGDMTGDGRVDLEDASQALTVALGAESANRFQSGAADLNGDLSVDASDAAAILYHVQHSTWPYLTDKPETTLTTTTPVSTTVISTNDVTTNSVMTNPVTTTDRPAVTSPTTMTVVLDDILYAPAQSVDMPQLKTILSAENLQSVTAGHFTILYDPTVISHVVAVTADTMLQDMEPDSVLFQFDDRADLGELKVSFASVTPISGSGPLSQLTFQLATGVTISQTDLRLVDAVFYDQYGRDLIQGYEDHTLRRESGTVSKHYPTYLPTILK